MSGGVTSGWSGDVQLSTSCILYMTGNSILREHDEA